MYPHRRFLVDDVFNNTVYRCYSDSDSDSDFDSKCKSFLPPPIPESNPNPNPNPSPSPSHSHRLSNSLLLAASLLSAAVLLSLTFFAVLRRRRRRHLSPAGTIAPAGNDDDGGGDAEPLHHAWYIRTVGLDDATIASIPVATHRGGGGGGGGGGDCSVCLGEFGDGELVRLLPKCAHAFHLSCIDTWLRAHVSCPLCRSLVVDPSTAAAADDDDDPPIASIPTPIATAESDPTQSDSDDEEASEEEEEEEEEEEVEEIENRAAIVSPDLPLPGSELQAPIDPVIGRSVSMDSPHVGASVAPEPPEAEESELNSQDYQIVIKEKEKDLQANLSKSPATSAHLVIERSLSSSSGRGFFFSRHGRARSSILPL